MSTSFFPVTREREKTETERNQERLLRLFQEADEQLATTPVVHSPREITVSSNVLGLIQKLQKACCLKSDIAMGELRLQQAKTPKEKVEIQEQLRSLKVEQARRGFASGQLTVEQYEAQKKSFVDMQGQLDKARDQLEENEMRLQRLTQELILAKNTTDKEVQRLAQDLSAETLKLAKAQTALDQKDNEIAKIQKQLEDVNKRAQNNELQAEFALQQKATLEGQLRTLRKERFLVDQKVRELNDLVKRQTRELAERDETIKQLTEDIEVRNADIENLERTTAEQRESIKQKESALATMTIENEELRGEVESGKKRVSELESDLNGIRVDRDDLRAQLSAESQRVTSLTQEKDDLEREVENGNKRITMLTQAEQKLQGLLEVTEDKLAKTTKGKIELEKVKAQLEATISSLNEEKDGLGKRVTELETKVAQQEATILASQEQIKTLNNTVTEKNKLIESLEGQVQDLSRENASLQDKNRGLSEQLAQVQGEQRKTLNELAERKRNEAALQENVRNLEAAKRKAEQVTAETQKQLEAKQTEIEELARSAKVTEDELRAKRETIDSLSSLLSNSEADRERLTAKVSRLQAENEELARQAEQARQVAEAQVKADMDKLSAQLAASQNEVQRLTEELLKTQRDWAEEKKRLDARIDELEEELSKTLKEKEEEEKQRKNLERLKRLAEMRNEALEKELQSAEARAEQVTREKFELQGQIDTAATILGGQVTDQGFSGEQLRDLANGMVKERDQFRDLFEGAKKDLEGWKTNYRALAAVWMPQGANREDHDAVIKRLREWKGETEVTLSTMKEAVKNMKEMQLLSGDREILDLDTSVTTNLSRVFRYGMGVLRNRSEDFLAITKAKNMDEFLQIANDIGTRVTSTALYEGVKNAHDRWMSLARTLLPNTDVSRLSEDQLWPKMDAMVEDMQDGLKRTRSDERRYKKIVTAINQEVDRYNIIHKDVFMRWNNATYNKDPSVDIAKLNEDIRQQHQYGKRIQKLLNTVSGRTQHGWRSTEKITGAPDKLRLTGLKQIRPWNPRNEEFTSYEKMGGDFFIKFKEKDSAVAPFLVETEQESIGSKRVRAKLARGKKK